MPPHTLILNTRVRFRTIRTLWKHFSPPVWIYAQYLCGFFVRKNKEENITLLRVGMGMKSPIEFEKYFWIYKSVHWSKFLTVLYTEKNYKSVPNQIEFAVAKNNFLIEATYSVRWRDEQ